MPTLQVDNINGKHLDAVYGEGEPSAHLYFFFGKSADGHSLGHYQILVPGNPGNGNSLELPSMAAGLLNL